MKILEVIDEFGLYKLMFGDNLLEKVTNWFRKEFMDWLFPKSGWDPEPKCPAWTRTIYGAQKICGAKMAGSMVLSNNPDYDWVEVWTCPKNTKHNFNLPRYNNLLRILETRKGRCSELSRLFMAIMFMLGFKARLVLDYWNNHVWVEVYYPDTMSNFRWIHVDPSENIVDEPMRYDKMGKEMLFVVAMDEDCIVTDVSDQYASDPPVRENNELFNQLLDLWNNQMNSLNMNQDID